MSRDRDPSRAPLPGAAEDIPPLRVALPRMLLRLLVIVALVWVVHLMMGWVMDQSSAMGASSNTMLGLVALFLVTYALLIAVPFVPGVEIGISLMLLRGAEVAPFVYLATVAGLSLAYLAGRYLPYDWLHRVFADLRMRRVCHVLSEIKPLSRERRLTLLRRNLPQWAARFAVDWRYLGLAVLFNLPGNSVLGGGGGIALVAGLSRLFTFRGVLLTVLIAVAPVPLAVWIFGVDLIS